MRLAPFNLPQLRALPAPAALERHLRALDRPILGRIHRGDFLFHLRTLWPEELPYVAQAIREVLS